MAVTAKFIADFSTFQDGVQKAVIQLDKFQGEVDQVAKSLTKMGNQFNGSKIIADATLMAEAIKRIGGVSTLTERELQQVGDAAQEAVAKFHALGKEVPDDIQKLADSINAVQRGIQAVGASGADNFQKVGAAIKDMGPGTSALGGWFDELGQHVLATAAGMVSAQAAINLVSGAFSSAVGFIKDSVKAYADAELGQKKLTVAMQAQGTATPAAIDAYAKLAKQFQDTTGFSNGLITKMETLLIEVGDVMPSKMEAALKASTDLAAGLGVDLETATNLVAKAAAGHTEALAKYGITVDAATAKSHGLSSVLDAINTRFGGQAAAQMETYAGQVEKVKNAWSDLQENVGRAIANDPLVVAGLRAISEAADKAKNSSESFGVSLKSVYEHIPVAGPLFAKLVEYYENQAKAANEAAAAQERLNAAQKAGAIGPVPSHAITTMPAAVSHDKDEAAQYLKEQEAIYKSIQARIDDLKNQSMVPLSNFQKGLIDQLYALGEAEGKIAPLFKGNEVAAQAYVDQLKKLTEEHKKHLDAVGKVKDAEADFGKTLQTVDTATQKRVANLLNQKVAEKDIADALGLTERQVHAVAQAEQMHADLMKIEGGATRDLSAAVKDLQGDQTNEIGRLKEWNAALEDHASMVRKLIEMESNHPLSNLSMVGTVRGPLTDEQVKMLRDYNKELDISAIKAKAAADAMVQFAQIGGQQIGTAAQQIGAVALAWNAASTAVAKYGADSEQAAAAQGALTGSIIGGITAGITMLISAYTSALDKQVELSNQLFQFKQDATDAFNAAVDALGGYSQALIDAVMNAKTLAEAQKALKELQATTKLAQEASQKYGPSADDLITAYKHAQAVYQLMIDTGGYTADQLRKAAADLDAAGVRLAGRVAMKNGDVITDAERAAAAAQDLADQATAAGYQTVAAMQESATQAEKLYEFMRDSGQYTAAQVADAFDKAQKAQEAALGQDSKAIDDLKAKYKSLADSVSQEAPEEVMGVIETQMRGQMAALDAQIKAAQDSTASSMASTMNDTTEVVGKHTTDIFNDVGVRIKDVSVQAADDMTTAAKMMGSDFADQGQKAAKAVSDSFAGLTIHIPIVWDVPPLPGPVSLTPTPIKMAAGGFGYASGPMLFSTQGHEFFAFSGEGQTFTSPLGKAAPPINLAELTRALAERDDMHIASLRRVLRDASMSAL